MPHDPEFRTRGRPARNKVDPRLALLLEMDPSRLAKLQSAEEARLGQIAARLKRDNARMSANSEEGELHAAPGEGALFAPLTSGLYDPSREGRSMRIQSDERFIAAFILSDASAQDLTDLGVRVRSQSGGVFSAFIPLSVIPALENSVAVRYIELARPVFPTLHEAIPLAQIDQLDAAGITGMGTIVGIIDSVLDIYHADFKKSANVTRVLYLWDQTLTPDPAVGEASPPATLYGSYAPNGTLTPRAAYGVEYTAAQINAQLPSLQTPNAYKFVRHNSAGEKGAHGTIVAGGAVGSGSAPSATGPHRGAAPDAEIIFVAHSNLHTTAVLADMTDMADAFEYIFNRASQQAKPCVVNMSNGDNLGPHDGNSPGERFLDSLLEVPGRAITLSAGNSTTTGSHVSGSVLPAGTTLSLDCDNLATNSDTVEIWYDGHDLFRVTVTPPGFPAITVDPGMDSGDVPLGTTGVSIRVSSRVDVPYNGDNCISIVFIVASGTMPVGTTTIRLDGTTVVNGAFHAWVDRNNRTPAGVVHVRFAPPTDEATLTLGSPGTARRPITVGNHNKPTAPASPAIHSTSGRGPTRDGRVKPEVAAAGVGVRSPYSQNRTSAPTVGDYAPFTGTSISAPIVAGACACLFQCRGPGTTWAQLKQILEDTAGTSTLTIPDPGFGFGYLRVGTGCAVPPAAVDVWVHDHAGDNGDEPYTGGVAWLSPDIEVLDMSRAAAANPQYAGANVVNNIIRVTVQNRGLQTARNTEVHLYWADPATYIPYPSAWNASGIYTETSNGFVNQSNTQVIPQLAPGLAARVQVEFGWAPPAPGANIRGDDHFCLLVRLENSADPSNIGSGGWDVITARNNIALRNTHVQNIAAGAEASMRFYIAGTPDDDSLMIIPDLVGGEVRLRLPVQALPWRDRAVLEAIGRRRPLYAGRRMPDPLATLVTTLTAKQAQTVTGVRNARTMTVADGIAEFTLNEGGPLHLPRIQLAEGARMVASVHVSSPRIAGDRRFVHIAQRSGGQLVGGVSLELRKS